MSFEVDFGGSLEASSSLLVQPPNWLLGGAGSGGQGLEADSGSAGTNLPALDFDFVNQRYYQSGQGNTLSSLLTISRASAGTDLLPTSASGAAYNSFISGQLRVTPGSGLLVEEGRTNLFLNSGAPVTQTINLSAGTYVTWVNGSGTLTTAAGTATGSGYGAASNGTPNVIVITIGGTVTFTKSGALNIAQVEAIGVTGTFGTSYIPTAGASVARAADVVSVTSVPAFGTSFTLFAVGLSPVTGALAGSPTLMEAAATASPATNRIILYDTTAPAAAVNIDNAALITMASWAGSVVGRIAFSGTAGAQTASFNGGAVGTAANAGFPTVQNLYVGTQHGGVVFWNSYVRRIAVWPTIAFPSTSLVNLSGGVA